MSKIITSFDKTKSNNGNKANSIITLLKNNISAPKTWVINYKYLIKVIREELGIDLNKKQNNYERIYKFLDNVPLKVYNEILLEVIDLKKQHKDIKRFAVRSSHVYEDGKNYSFSGLFQTELNLFNSINITNAIFHCWRDCFTSGIQKYSKNSRIRKIIPCSIIIQEFIITNVSGVAFRFEDTVYINSTFGMAKSIVDGETGFDSWKINNDSYEVLEYENTKNTINMPLFTKTNPRKGEKISFFTDSENELVVENFNNKDNYVKASLNTKMIKTPSLNNEMIKKLLDLFKEVSEKLNIDNYDIEWGIKNNEIFILQCRNLTRKVFLPSKRNYSYLPLVSGEAIGKAYLVETETDAKNFSENSIIVAKNLSGAVLLATSKAVGCILESKSPLSHSAIIARELGIPAVGAVDKDKILNGSLYRINGTNGSVELLDEDYIDIKKTEDKKINFKRTDKSKLFLDIIERYN